MKTDQFWFYCFLGALVVIFILLFVYIWKIQNNALSQPPPPQPLQTLPPPPPSDVEETPKSSISSRPQIVLFWGSWCGNCTVMLPEWEKVEKELEDQCLKIESSNVDDMKANNIQAVPTILYFPSGYSPGGDSIRYSGARDAKSILDFVRRGGK